MRTVSEEASPTDRLRHLIVRIACRDRAAFRALYDDTCGRVRDGLESRLGDTTWAAGVLVATYVEVWWLAGWHTDPGCDTVAWMNDIVKRRVAEGPPVVGCAETGLGGLADIRIQYAETELAGLLGRPVDTLRAGGAGRPGQPR
jgi:hypothetical protein